MNTFFVITNLTAYDQKICDGTFLFPIYLVINADNQLGADLLIGYF